MKIYSFFITFLGRTDATGGWDIMKPFVTQNKSNLEN